MSKKKIITLFVMTEKGYEFLKKISIKYKHLIHIVVIGNDNSIDKDFAEDIKKFCIDENIHWIHKSYFEEVESKYAMAVSWRWLIKHPIDRLIIFHDSLLPKYRGYSPLVNSLINGEKEIGVTALFGAENYDTGDIIIQSKSKISYPITIAKAIQVNMQNYFLCADPILNRLMNDELIPRIKQMEKEATYSLWRDEHDYRIDWNKSSGEIRRFIDAVGPPYKGASSIYNGKLLRILKAEEYLDINIENRQGGKVIFLRDGEPVVVCGSGTLRISEAYIQLEDGSTTSFFPLTNFRVRFF